MGSGVVTLQFANQDDIKDFPMVIASGDVYSGGAWTVSTNPTDYLEKTWDYIYDSILLDYHFLYLDTFKYWLPNYPPNWHYPLTYTLKIDEDLVKNGFGVHRTGEGAYLDFPDPYEYVVSDPFYNFSTDTASRGWTRYIWYPPGGYYVYDSSGTFTSSPLGFSTPPPFTFGGNNWWTNHYPPQTVSMLNDATINGKSIVVNPKCFAWEKTRLRADSEFSELDRQAQAILGINQAGSFFYSWGGFSAYIIAWVFDPYQSANLRVLCAPNSPPSLDLRPGQPDSSIRFGHAVDFNIDGKDYTWYCFNSPAYRGLDAAYTPPVHVNGTPVAWTDPLGHTATFTPYLDYYYRAKITLQENPPIA
jgi:hypothetical protein